MKNFIGFFLVLFLGISPLWAIIQTDTHTYIVSRKDNIILAIDRKTGQETKIETKYGPQYMIIAGTMGYVTNANNRCYTKINLTTHQIIDSAMPYSYHEVYPLVIYGTTGYVGCISQGSLELLPYFPATPSPILTEQGVPQSIAIDGDLGYFVNRKNSCVMIIDLKTNKIGQRIDVGLVPNFITVHQEFAYVTSVAQPRVDVIDLKTQKVIKKLTVGWNPESISFYKDKGYVMNRCSNCVSVIDLNSKTEIKTIPVGKQPEFMKIHGGLGFITNRASDDVYVLDLESDTVISTIPNPDNKSVGLSDTHLYLGIEKVVPYTKYLTLFDTPYPGIKGPFTDAQTGEKAFQNFEQALKELALSQARDYFEIALAAGHPSAYAIAAFSFLHEKLGAKDPDALNWYHEFYQGMDQRYYSKFASLYQ